MKARSSPVPIWCVAAVLLWDVHTGRPLTEELNAGVFVPSACFHPSGERIGFATKDGLVQIWPVPLATTPVPAGFLEFAEGLAGVRVSLRGLLEILPPATLEQDTRGLIGESPDSVYNRIFRQFSRARL